MLLPTCAHSAATAIAAKVVTMSARRRLDLNSGNEPSCPEELLSVISKSMECERLPAYSFEFPLAVVPLTLAPLVPTVAIRDPEFPDTPAGAQSAATSLRRFRREGEHDRLAVGRRTDYALTMHQNPRQTSGESKSLAHRATPAQPSSCESPNANLGSA